MDIFIVLNPFVNVISNHVTTQYFLGLIITISLIVDIFLLNNTNNNMINGIKLLMIDIDRYRATQPLLQWRILHNIYDWLKVICLHVTFSYRLLLLSTLVKQLQSQFVKEIVSGLFTIALLRVGFSQSFRLSWNTNTAVFQNR